MEERRRSPRRMAQGQVAIVAPTMSVQLLDITAAGVLLQAPEPVERGSEGRLGLSLDGMPLKADVRVERLAVAKRSAGYHVGATFVALTPDQRQLIKRFMTS